MYLDFYFVFVQMQFNANDVAKGECKGLGEPRSNQEAYCVFNLGIDAELVRGHGVEWLLENGLVDQDKFGNLILWTYTKEEETVEPVVEPVVEPEVEPTPKKKK